MEGGYASTFTTAKNLLNSCSSATPSDGTTTASNTASLVTQTTNTAAAAGVGPAGQPRKPLDISFEWYSDHKYLVEFKSRRSTATTAVLKDTTNSSTSNSSSSNGQCSGSTDEFLKYLVQHYGLQKVDRGDSAPREDSVYYFCPQESYNELKAKVQSIQGCRVDDIPSTVHSVLIRHRKGKQVTTTDVWNSGTIPSSITRWLRPFQREAIEYGINRKGKILLADEMGTGKTLQAISLMRHYVADWPLLIVCPASLKLMWANELQVWLPELQPGDLRLMRGGKMINAMLQPVSALFQEVVKQYRSRKRKDKRSMMAIAVHVLSQRLRNPVKNHTRFVNNDEYVSHFPPVAIVSYTLLSRWFQRIVSDTEFNTHSKAAASNVEQYNVLGKILADAFPSLVSDEAHCLRKPDSLRTMAVMNMSKHAARVVLLTGTPCLSKPLDLFPLLHGLRPHLFQNRLQFAMRYCGPERKYEDGVNEASWSFGGVSKVHELNAILQKEIMIRRLKRQVLPELPEKTRQCIMLSPPSNSSSWSVETDRCVKYIQKEREERKKARCTQSELCGMVSSLVRKGILYDTSQAKLSSEIDLELLRQDETQVPTIAERIVRDSASLALQEAYDCVRRSNMAAARRILDREDDVFDSNDGETEETSDCQIDSNDSSSLDLWHATGVAKAEAIGEYALEWVKTYLSSGSSIKILIFAHHANVMDRIHRMMLEQQISMVRVDGTMLPQERAAAVEEFQTNRYCSVALVSMTAGGEGHCFSAADLVLFGELHHLVGVLLQAEDRAHRMSSSGNAKGKPIIDNGGRVTIQYLVARGTWDDLLWGKLCHRLKAIGKTVNGAPIELGADIHTAETQEFTELSTSSVDCSTKQKQQGLSIENEEEASQPRRSSVKHEKLSFAELTGVVLFMVCSATHRVYIYTAELQYTGLNFVPEEYVVSPADADACAECSSGCIFSEDRRTVFQDGGIHNDTLANKQGGNCNELEFADRPQISPLISCRCWEKVAHLFSLDWCSINAVTKEELCNAFLSLPLGPIVSSLRDKHVFGSKLQLTNPKENLPTTRYAPITGAIKYSQLERVGQSSTTEEDNGACLRCAHCSATVIQPLYLSTVSNPYHAASNTTEDAGAVGTRKYAVPFCSEKCNRAYWGKRRNGAIRSYLSELEHGVCQICGIDARRIYREVSCLYREEQKQVEEQWARSQFAISEWKARFLLEVSLEFRLSEVSDSVSTPIMRNKDDADTGRALRQCEYDAITAKHVLDDSLGKIEDARIDHILRTEWKPRKNTTYKVLKKATTLIRNPQEGSYWQADHIVPVVEGGGSCGWTNFRTLCTSCHRQVTAELRARLKKPGRKDVIIIECSQTQDVSDQTAVSSNVDNDSSQVKHDPQWHSREASTTPATDSCDIEIVECSQAKDLPGRRGTMSNFSKDSTSCDIEVTDSSPPQHGSGRRYTCPGREAPLVQMSDSTSCSIEIDDAEVICDNAEDNDGAWEQSSGVQSNESVEDSCGVGDVVSSTQRPVVATEDTNCADEGLVPAKRKSQDRVSPPSFKTFLKRCRWSQPDH
eukprot:gb/GECG01008267.1/.p1 GENE.gb/GECG01008267.1/~~gb/GECG01008267.1/.p1  ORF type:complete len:1555 (+),score=193.94 gb/GECG01008267.1/:1-4665(+)